MFTSLVVVIFFDSSVIFSSLADAFTGVSSLTSAFVVTSVVFVVFSAATGVSDLAVSAFSSVVVVATFSATATVVSCLLVSAACATPPRNIKADAIRTDAVPALNFLIP